MSLVMVVFFSGMIIISHGYPIEARLVPWVVAIPGLFLSVIQFVIDIIDIRKGKLKSAQDEKGFVRKKRVKSKVSFSQDKGSTSDEFRKELIMMGWIVAVAALILLFGFWVGIAAFLPAFLRIYGKESWRLTLIVTGCGWAAIYIMFKVVLSVRLFEGYLFMLI